MPVDVSGIHQIIQAWMMGQQIKQRREQFAADQEQELQMQENLLKQQKEINAADHAARLAEINAAKAEQERQHKQNLYMQLFKGLSSGEIPAQGFDYTPPTAPIPGLQQPEQTVISPEQNFNILGEKFTLPGNVVRTPEQITRQLAGRAGAIRGAQVTAEMPKVSAQAQIRLMEDFFQNQLNESRDTKRFAAQDEALTKRLESSERVADKRMASMLAGIELRMRDKKIDPVILESHLPNLADGTYTMEDLPKLGFNGDTRLALTSAMEERGLKFINKDQQKQLYGLGEVQNLFKSYKELADIYGNAGVNISKRLLNPKVIALNKTIDATLERIARTFGGSKGVITDKDAVRMKGLKPDAITMPGVNTQKINEVKRMFEGGTNSLLSGMDDSQQYSIRKKYGLSLNNFVRGPSGDWMKVEDIK